MAGLGNRAGIRAADFPDWVLVGERIQRRKHVMISPLARWFQDSTLFFREWMVDPKRTGSVTPSSRHLSAAMAGWLPENPDSYVLELGPGTGAVTHRLLENGLREDRLIVIEANPKLARVLRQRFSRAHIVCGDAWELDGILGAMSPGVASVGAVISSLPLVSFSPEMAASLVRKIDACLEPSGYLVQFSYSIHRKRSRGSDGFHQHASRIVWRNFPPARVHVYRK